MRGLVVAVVGALGLGAWWRRRRRHEPETAAELGPDPAEELRAKLAENRASDEPDEAEAEEPPPDPDARRRDVHERARSAIDDLKS